MQIITNSLKSAFVMEFSSSPLLNRISELEDTLKSKSVAEKALEQQKEACDCHVISMS